MKLKGMVPSQWVQFIGRGTVCKYNGSGCEIIALSTNANYYFWEWYKSVYYRFINNKFFFIPLVRIT